MLCSHSVLPRWLQVLWTWDLRTELEVQIWNLKSRALAVAVNYSCGIRFKIVFFSSICTNISINYIQNKVWTWIYLQYYWNVACRCRLIIFQEEIWSIVELNCFLTESFGTIIIISNEFCIFLFKFTVFGIASAYAYRKWSDDIIAMDISTQRLKEWDEGIEREETCEKWNVHKQNTHCNGLLSERKREPWERKGNGALISTYSLSFHFQYLHFKDDEDYRKTKNGFQY